MGIKKVDRLKFYKAIRCLEECSDTVIKNKYGVIIERGITLNDKEIITHHLEDNTINFYVNNEIVLSIDCGSPIISMFEELILSMNEE